MSESRPTADGVTYRDLAAMPTGQFRLLLNVVGRSRAKGLSVDETVEQIRWALNREAADGV